MRLVDDAKRRLAMTRVLVTGATGYIGVHLVRYLLERGAQVRCLVRAGSARDALPTDDVEFIEGSLLDASSLAHAVKNCDAVYHLAGLTSAIMRRELFQVNGQGTFDLASACAKQETPPKLIVVSSLAAAGTAIRGKDRDTNDPDRPISEYGRSKRAGELAAVAWSDRMPVSIVRPGIVFGERNRELLPVFQSIARFRLHVVPGYSPRRVGMIHHDDLIELLWRVEHHGQRVTRDGEALAERRGRTGYYFAIAPEAPSYRELGRIIARAIPIKPMLIMPVAEPVAWLAAMGNQSVNSLRGRSESFNVDKLREAFAGDWVGSPIAALQDLQFQPALSLQARMNQTARWYKQHGWL